MIEAYVQELVATYPCVREVWLFGSRANGTATLNSDWDYLLYSDDNGLFTALSQDRRLWPRAGMDVFIAVPGTGEAAQPTSADHPDKPKTLVLRRDLASGGMDWQRDHPLGKASHIDAAKSGEQRYTGRRVYLRP